MEARRASDVDLEQGGSLREDADGDADILQGCPLLSAPLIEVTATGVDRPQVDGRGEAQPGDRGGGPIAQPSISGEELPLDSLRAMPMR